MSETYAELKKITVLCYDDDPRIAKSIKTTIAKLGAIPLQAKDARECKKFIREETFDIAFLDTLSSDTDISSPMLTDLKTYQPEVGRGFFSQAASKKEAILHMGADLFLLKPLIFDPVEVQKALVNLYHATVIRRTIRGVCEAVPRDAKALPNLEGSLAQLSEQQELKIFVTALRALRNLKPNTHAYVQLLAPIRQHRWWRDFMTEDHRRHDDPVVIEKFEGRVDQIRDHTAYLSLIDSKGRRFDVEADPEELQKQDIQEGVRLHCRWEESQGKIAAIYTSDPLTENEWQRIQTETKEQFRQVRSRKPRLSREEWERTLTAHEQSG